MAVVVPVDRRGGHLSLHQRNSTRVVFGEHVEVSGLGWSRIAIALSGSRVSRPIARCSS